MGIDEELAGRKPPGSARLNVPVVRHAARPTLNRGKKARNAHALDRRRATPTRAWAGARSGWCGKPANPDSLARWEQQQPLPPRMGQRRHAIPPRRVAELRGRHREASGGAADSPRQQSRLQRRRPESVLRERGDAVGLGMGAIHGSRCGGSSSTICVSATGSSTLTTRS